MKQRTPNPTGPTEKLLEMMAANDPPIKQADLARDLGLSPTAILRYVRQLGTHSLDDRTWTRLARVFRDKYGLDVSAVRPVNWLSIDTSLVRHLDVFESKAQLEALVKIMEGSDKQEARDLLLVLARDRLAR